MPVNLQVSEENGQHSFFWSGTIGEVTVELRQNNQVKYNAKTVSNSVTFSGLVAGQYDVFVSGVYVKTVTIAPKGNGGNTNSTFDIQISNGSVPKSKLLTWKGQTGIVDVEIKTGDHSVYKTKTRFNTILLPNLSDGTYQVFIGNEYAGNFDITGTTPSGGTSPSNGSNPVPSNFTVKDGISKNSKVVEWSGTSGVVPVEVKLGDKTFFKQNTRFTSIVLSNLVPGTYDVYVNQNKLGSFTIEADQPGTSPTNPQVVTDFLVTESNVTNTKLVSWKGTSGIVLVEVKQDTKVVYKTQTRMNNVLVPSLPAASYDVYIDGIKAGSFISSGSNSSGSGSIQGPFKNVKVSKKNSDTVQISWEGTTGKVTVELRKKDGTKIKSKKTDQRNVTFDDLDEDVTYQVFSDEKLVTEFIIDKLKDVQSSYDVKIQKVNTNGVKINWSNTSGFVDIELKKGSKIFDSDRTDRRTVTFANLDPEEEYRLYLNDNFIVKFSLINIDEANKNKEVKNVKIKTRENEEKVEVSWKGTTGVVEVALKTDNKNIASKRTDQNEVTFYRVPTGKEYKLFIQGKYVESFDFGDVPEEAKEVTVTAGNPPVITWSGTKGDVKVELKKGTRAIFSKTTSDKEMKIEGVEDGTYTIFLNDKQTNKTVTVSKRNKQTFPIPSQRISFKDVAQNYWAQDSIMKLAQIGILNGFQDGTFKPDSTVTREQFVQMLAVAKKLSQSGNYSPFADVEQTRWSTPAIIAVIESGIVKPDELGNFFEPGKAITREEMAIYISRAEGFQDDASQIRFVDRHEIRNQGLVGAAVKAKLISGFPNNTFRPTQPLTRAQAAYVINKILR